MGLWYGAVAADLGLDVFSAPPTSRLSPARASRKDNEGSLSSSAPLMHENGPETCSVTRRGRSSSW